MKSYLSKKKLKRIIKEALEEDIGLGDVTTNLTIPKEALCRARIIAKDTGILCGINFAEKVFKTINPKITFKAIVKDGSKVSKGKVVARIIGPARAILAGERVALNIICRLSGISTMTNNYVQYIKNVVVRKMTIIMGTRKTTPLLRGLEKYAVRCGGGKNHRFNLSSQILVKENHQIIKPISVAKLRKKAPKNLLIEVEVRTIKEFVDIVTQRPDIILLDNMTLEQIRTANKLRKELAPEVKLEASGGINLKNIRQIAKTGVDCISIGSLTHSAPALDFSLLVDKCLKQ